MKLMFVIVLKFYIGEYFLVISISVYVMYFIREF